MNPRLAALSFLPFLLGPAWGQSTASDRVITTDPLEVRGARMTASAVSTSHYGLAEPLPVLAPIQDLSGQAANLHWADAGARSFTTIVSLRGLTNTPLFGDPAVTVYLDDLPLGSTFALPSELVGFAGAELFRGMGQNTRFGRAGSAGVLRFSTPSERRGAAGDLRAAFGNSGQSRVVATGGAGTGAGAADVYAAVGYRAREGYITNTTLRQRVDDQEARSGLVRYRIRSESAGTWTLLATGERTRDGAQALVPLDGPKDEVSRSGEGVTDIDTLGLALSGAFSTALGELRTTTAYSDWRLDPAINVLGFGFADLQNTSYLRQSVWSEEITLSSAPSSDFPWSAGVFGSSGRTRGEFERAFFGQTFEASSYRIRQKSAAAFGEASLRLGDAWTLTPGVRVETGKKDLTRVESVPQPTAFERSRGASAVLPRIAAVYRPDARSELSAGFVSGFKPGGFSAFTGNRALSAFDAERSRGAEIAFSRRAQDGTWGATVRGFAYHISDYQIERSFQTGAVADDYLVVNADRARSWGAEVEMRWQPFTGFTMGADAGFTHATLRSFRDPYTNVDYSGKRAPYVPRFDASLHAEYRLASGWFIAGRVDVTGRTFYTEGEDTLFSQGTYALVSGRLGYARENYSVALYGANLAEREYFASITPGTFHGTPGAPRTYGIEVGYRF